MLLETKVQEQVVVIEQGEIKAMGSIENRYMEFEAV